MQDAFSQGVGFESEVSLTPSGDMMQPAVQRTLRDWMQLVIREGYGSAQKWAQSAEVAATTITRALNNPDAPTPSTTTIEKLNAAAKAIGSPTFDEFRAKQAPPARRPVTGALLGNENSGFERLEIPSKVLPPIPILGTAQGGTDGLFFNDGESQGMTPRPPVLEGVSKGFAVYQSGTSMEPRYYSGELLYINPGRPVRPGNYVLLETTDRRGFVKKLVRLNDSEIVVSQHNPEEEIRFPRGEILHIYRVVGTAEA